MEGGEGRGHCQGTNGADFGPVIGLERSKQMVIPVDIIPEAGIKGKQTLQEKNLLLCFCSTTYINIDINIRIIEKSDAVCRWAGRQRLITTSEGGKEFGRQHQGRRAAHQRQEARWR